MRVKLVLSLSLFLLIICVPPTTALPPPLAAAINLALGQTRGILITVARTQAFTAFFKGLDETKECLQSQAKSKRNDDDISNCFVGPLRTISGGYLLFADLNSWFFGVVKEKKQSAVKLAGRVVVRALTVSWLLNSGVGKHGGQFISWLRRSKWYKWVAGKGERPGEVENALQYMRQKWGGISSLFNSLHSCTMKEMKRRWLQNKVETWSAYVTANVRKSVLGMAGKPTGRLSGIVAELRRRLRKSGCMFC